MPDDSYLTKEVLKELKRMNKNILTDKYLWNLTQDFNFYSDICNVLTTIACKKIGSYCKIFKAKKNENVIYIWIRGTDLIAKEGNGKIKINWKEFLKDLLVDMFFFKKKLKDKMKIHTGFWTAIESIYTSIERFLFKQYFKKIVIFGHSMGGAMSKEVARRLDELFHNIKIITFGTPRTGNKYYAKEFDNYNMIEYINRADIVTKLPLRVMNYRHTSKIKRLGKWGISIKAHLNYGEYL